MPLNHPEITPRCPIYGKTVLHESDPWCQKGWGPEGGLFSPRGTDLKAGTLDRLAKREPSAPSAFSSVKGLVVDL